MAAGLTDDRSYAVIIMNLLTAHAAAIIEKEMKQRLSKEKNKWAVEPYMIKNYCPTASHSCLIFTRLGLLINSLMIIFTGL